MFQFSLTVSLSPEQDNSIPRSTAAEETKALSALAEQIWRVVEPSIREVQSELQALEFVTRFDVREF